MSIEELDRENHNILTEYQRIYDDAKLHGAEKKALEIFLEKLEHHKNIILQINQKEAVGARIFAEYLLEDNNIELSDIEKHRFKTAIKYMPKGEASQCAMEINFNKEFDITRTYFMYGPRINKLEHLINKLVGSEGNVLVNAESLTKKTDERIIPEYINKLVENGYVGTDGITALASLDNIAEFLRSLKLDNFSYKTLLQFRKHNGEPFAENSAKEIAKRTR